MGGAGHPVVEVRQQGRRPLFVEIREPLEIGRECDGILLLDLQASRRHAVVSPRGDTVLLEDVGSTNGTFLDGVRISSPVVLTPGAVAQVGDTTLHLVGDAPAAVRPADEGPIASRQTAMPGAPVRAAASGPTNIRETSMESVARAVEAAPPPVAPAELDHGTITIVFSDIESSTQRATAMGDVAWMRVLSAHNGIITRHVERWGGTVVKNQGDGFMLTFNGARQALRAMIGVQQELERYSADNPDLGVRIRVGVHTGEVIAEEGDIFGKHVMLAARVGGLAEGGEILVSSIVKEIASARGDLTFGPPQVVALKGIEGEHVVHQLLWREFSESS
ncbi:MAG TPA: adenylate/guanylate cyclase domain-containing protein [Acidimicrobiales bacterium]|nr:adenylate/guanylate cyclase domain-containing protein [Acidimicrobiales bacterium]